MERTKERSLFFRKFIGDKKFYMMVLAVAVPIMIQNGITNFVSLLDNIMIGRIGTEQMSGASIVNQLIFVYNLAIFGAVLVLLYEYTGSIWTPIIAHCIFNTATLINILYPGILLPYGT